MKNLLILTFIFSSILLVSCGKQENIENITNTNSGGILVQTGTEIQTENTEITNTGIIQQKPIKEVKKIRSIAIENFNVVLKEDGKTINKLTTKATGQKECKWNKDKEEYYIYNITNQNQNYGIVKRENYPCGAHYTGITYFGIDLENNTELTELPIGGEIKTELENNIIKLTILSPETIVDKVEDERIETSKKDMISEGFIQKGNDWVKTIDLKNIIKPEIKKEVKVENKKVETPKFDSKYSDANLKKDGYKFNDLGKIKEYYKKTSSANHQPQNDGGLVEYSNIFIQGDKILDIYCNYREGGGTSGFTPIIRIFDGKNTKELYSISDSKRDFELFLETDITPIPVIFKEGKSKLIVDGNLNNIRLKDEINNLNMVIWKR